MWPPSVGLPMTKPALSATALLTSSSDMVSKFRVLMPTPASLQQEAFQKCITALRIYT